MARPTVARIDLDALADNVRAVRSLVGGRTICAAVKADAYGHGAAVVCHTLGRAGVDLFGVAMTEEGVELRQGGIAKPIVLLTAVPADDIEALLDHRLTACLVDEPFARELAAAALRRGASAEAHVNVDTGMHRIGFDWEQAPQCILRMSDLAGLRITGLFSHFACSDADSLDFSHEQIRRLRCVVRQLRRAGAPVPHVHMANSNAVLRLPGSYFDGVRPGLILYGLYSRPELRSTLALKPVMSMRSRIIHCRRLPEGEGLGYGHTFATWRDSTIATLPIGYHDGYIRQFSNVGQILVRSRRVPVVGRVCMDQTLIDVTEVPGVQVGDEAVIYGRQGDALITIEEMARLVDRIPYELTCSVGPRVRREFVENGQVVVETPSRSVVPTGTWRQAFPGAVPLDEALDTGPRRRGAA